MAHKNYKLLVLILILSLTIPLTVSARSAEAPNAPIPFTILHTNDFHGNLEAGGYPGAARGAQKIVDVRAAVGAQNMLLFDAGDVMQGTLLSNLWQGEPTFDYYRTIGYNGITFGNHEFDWGQTVLGDRIAQAEAPATADETPVQTIVANITLENPDGTCSWTPFNANVTPYEVFTVGTAPNTVNVGVIGVGSVETPYITIASATDGLCFRDPAESILHYYDALNAASDVIVVLSHNGLNDGGYGYGFTVYGDRTLAKMLNTAGKPVNLIIGGHSHTDVTTAYLEGSTVVAQAHSSGRKIGRADMTYDPATGAVTINWTRIVVGMTDPQFPPVQALIQAYIDDPDYQALIHTPIGYAQTDLLRNYNGDAMMGDFIDDAIYNQLNTDVEPLNDVDLFVNNAGGIRIDWCDAWDAVNNVWVWSSTAADCQPGVWAHDPMLLEYQHMFQILPFGNATIVGDMTGAQILDLLNQSATLFKGAIQPSGIRYDFFSYADSLPGPQPYAWGAFNVEVYNKATLAWEPLEMDRTYRVGTNEFLAPAGQDGYVPFKYMTNISYWGDMLNAVNAWVEANYTFAAPYLGPNGDGTLDGRITRDGTNAGGSIIPLTVLHHNDSHGNLAKGSYPGYTQLVTLINQARAHNPTRTLLLSSGDNIQGDSMMYYFKSAGLGYAADGTPLPTDLQINPLIKAFNLVGYDAYTLGNHEFNFGKDVFGTLAQADFPILQANLEDDGQYGIANIPVEDYVEKTVGVEGIKVAIMGIGNHRVPNYELPSNIPGLTFTDPMAKAQELSDALNASNDVVVALTHIGFTENPGSVEIDNNVDTYMAEHVTGLDTIIGGHSHTNPATGFGLYKYLPAVLTDPDNLPVIVSSAYRYNNTLGQVIFGLLPKAGGGYDVVSRAGRYQTVAMGSTPTPEDTTVKTLIQPYVDLLAAYNNTDTGYTTEPVDALQAYTQETNGANLQADAAVWELEDNHGIPVDFHLSGAMSNRKVAPTATPANPVMLKVSDMFQLMPYENSLVVMEMNGPQIKAVLERAYRNYYYYKYVPGYGGYSYYTTCMIDINAGGQITYNDLNDAAYDPNQQYVVSLTYVDDQGVAHEVDFNDAATYYRVSTVNYLAAGSCNFNDAGVSLWPLNQIVNDTQFYVRDSVIYYVTAMGTVSPVIEGRLQFIFDRDAPVITITSPTAMTYDQSATLTLEFSAVDAVSGVDSVWADLDGVAVVTGQQIPLYTLLAGEHTLTVYAMDNAYNQSQLSVTFTVSASVQSTFTALQYFFNAGEIDGWGIYNSLLVKLNAAQKALDKGNIGVAINLLNSFINDVQAQAGKQISEGAAIALISDAQWVIDYLAGGAPPKLIELAPTVDR